MLLQPAFLSFMPIDVLTSLFFPAVKFSLSLISGMSSESESGCRDKSFYHLIFFIIIFCFVSSTFYKKKSVNFISFRQLKTGEIHLHLCIHKTKTTVFLRINCTVRIINNFDSDEVLFSFLMPFS